jgi:hypothetical protein
LEVGNGGGGDAGAGARGGMESRVGAQRKRGKRPCKRSCRTGDGCRRTPLWSEGYREWGRQTKGWGSGAMIRTDYETRAASIGFTP